MLIKNFLRRAVAVSALAATALAPALASAATYVQHTSLAVGGQTLTIAGGSQYESLTVDTASFTVTLAAGQAFIVRAPGTSPRALENDANQPSCNVLTNRDNQLLLNGPVVATVTPSNFGCSTADYQDDRTPFVTIVSPNGGQTVATGDTVQVFWTNAGNPTAAVRLSLSTDGGQTNPTVIADGIINNGFFTWIVPDMPSASHARIRFDGLDQGRVVAFDLSDADFAIEGTSSEPPPSEDDEEEGTPSAHPPYDPESETAAASTIDEDKDFYSLVVNLDGSCVPGTRIKGPVNPAVYYCSEDGKRHAFPNQRIHDSWYQGFEGVVTLTDAQLAGIPLGENVTYRPGVRMVKIQTDPKVYAVAKNGTLRWVPDEWTALRLYGAAWNTKIDDLSDAFFTDYVIGEPVPTN